MCTLDNGFGCHMFMTILKMYDSHWKHIAEPSKLLLANSRPIFPTSVRAWNRNSSSDMRNWLSIWKKHNANLSFTFSALANDWAMNNRKAIASNRLSTKKAIAANKLSPYIEVNATNYFKPMRANSSSIMFEIVGLGDDRSNICCSIVCILLYILTLEKIGS